MRISTPLWAEQDTISSISRTAMSHIHLQYHHIIPFPGLPVHWDTDEALGGSQLEKSSLKFFTGLVQMFEGKPSFYFWKNSTDVINCPSLLKLDFVINLSFTKRKKNSISFSTSKSLINWHNTLVTTALGELLCNLSLFVPQRRARKQVVWIQL